MQFEWKFKKFHAFLFNPFFVFAPENLFPAIFVSFREYSWIS